jgi:hypothetical protein
LIGIKVTVPGEDVLDQILLLTGEPLRDRTTRKVFAKLLDRRLADMNGG